MIFNTFCVDEYGELGADAFKKEARRLHICISTEERISTKNESMRDSVENLIKKFVLFNFDDFNKLGNLGFSQIKQLELEWSFYLLEPNIFLH